MAIKPVLPEVGNDWLDGLRDHYIILSLKHSSLEVAMFWKADDSGYTGSLANAGKYARREVESALGYYNDGVNTIAIPCTQAAFETLGMFTVVVDFNMVKVFFTKQISTVSNK